MSVSAHSFKLGLDASSLIKSTGMSRQEVNQLSKAVRDLESPLEKVEKLQKNLAKALDVGALNQEQFAKATAKANEELQKLKLDEAREKVDKYNEALGGITAASAAIAAATGLIIKSSLEQAAAYETTQVQFEILIGSVSKAESVLKDLSKFAADTPFQMPDIQIVAKDLINFGESGRAMMTTLKMLGDIAAVSGKDLVDLSRVYNKIRSEGKLTNETLQQMAGVLSTADLAKYFRIAETEVRKFVTAGNVGFNDVRVMLQALTSEGGKFEDGMKRLSETADGLESTLNDNLNLALRDIGTELLPIKKAFTDFGITLIATFTSASPTVKTFTAYTIGLGFAATAAAAAIGGLALAFVNLKLAATSAIASISALKYGVVALGVASKLAVGGLIAIAAAAATLIGMHIGKSIWESINADHIERSKDLLDSLRSSIEDLKRELDFTGVSVDGLKQYESSLEASIKATQEHNEQLIAEQAWYNFWGKNADLISVNIEKVQALEEQLERVRSQLNSTDAEQDIYAEPLAKLKEQIDKLKEEPVTWENLAATLPDISTAVASGMSDESFESFMELRDTIVELQAVEFDGTIDEWTRLLKEESETAGMSARQKHIWTLEQLLANDAVKVGREELARQISELKKLDAQDLINRAAGVITGQEQDRLGLTPNQRLVLELEEARINANEEQTRLIDQQIQALNRLGQAVEVIASGPATADEARSKVLGFANSVRDLRQELEDMEALGAGLPVLDPVLRQLQESLGPIINAIPAGLHPETEAMLRQLQALQSEAFLYSQQYQELLAIKKEVEEYDDFKRQAQDIKESQKSESELFNEEVERLAKLRKLDLISREQYVRAVSEAQKKLLRLFTGSIVEQYDIGEGRGVGHIRHRGEESAQNIAERALERVAAPVFPHLGLNRANLGPDGFPRLQMGDLDPDNVGAYLTSSDLKLVGNIIQGLVQTGTGANRTLIAFKPAGGNNHDAFKVGGFGNVTGTITAPDLNGSFNVDANKYEIINGQSRPSFAEGGMLPGTGPIPILAHGGELIVPAANVRQGLSGIEQFAIDNGLSFAEGGIVPSTKDRFKAQKERKVFEYERAKWHKRTGKWAETPDDLSAFKMSSQMMVRGANIAKHGEPTHTSRIPQRLGVGELDPLIGALNWDGGALNQLNEGVRNQLNDLFIDLAGKQGAGQNKIPDNVRNEINSLTNKLMDELRALQNQITPADYLYSKSFLNGILLESKEEFKDPMFKDFDNAFKLIERDKRKKLLDEYYDLRDIVSGRIPGLKPDVQNSLRLQELHNSLYGGSELRLNLENNRVNYRHPIRDPGPFIPRLSRGTSMVMESGLASIHAGEAVVPAKVAQDNYFPAGQNEFQREEIEILRESRDYLRDISNKRDQVIEMRI